MDRQKILKKIDKCLMENNIFNIDVAKEIVDIIEDELDFGQVNISYDNSNITAIQNNKKKR
jgi:hypothetical protein